MQTSSQFTNASSMNTNNMPQVSGGESRTSTFSETVRGGDCLPIHLQHNIHQKPVAPNTVPEVSLSYTVTL